MVPSRDLSARGGVPKQDERGNYRAVAENPSLKKCESGKSEGILRMQMLVFLPSDVGERITCEPSMFK